MAADPIATIVSLLCAVRPDWEPDHIADLFRRGDVPREKLLRALAAGSQAVDSTGAYLLAEPQDVLDGAWLIAAQAEIDQQDAADRER